MCNMSAALWTLHILCVSFLVFVSSSCVVVITRSLEIRCQPPWNTNDTAPPGFAACRSVIEFLFETRKLLVVRSTVSCFVCGWTLFSSPKTWRQRNSKRKVSTKGVIVHRTIQWVCVCVCARRSVVWLWDESFGNSSKKLAKRPKPTE